MMRTNNGKHDAWAMAPALLLAMTALSADALAQPPAGDSADLLARRDRVQLTLAGAQQVIAVSRQKAKAIGVAVNIAVVDDGGHLLAFARMDGARPGSVYTSMTKATSAATKRGPTGPLPNAETPNTHLSLAVEHAADQSGGKFTTLLGGIPIVVDGQVIGAIGVGGATGEQDAQVAQAGVDALTGAIAAAAATDAAANNNTIDQ